MTNKVIKLINFNCVINLNYILLDKGPMYPK